MTYLLPCRPKPQPDELFSSWMIRLGNTYRTQFCDFLYLLGLAQHLHNSDIDRVAPGSLVKDICELTGTDPKEGRGTLLTHRMTVLHNDRLRIDTPEWPWLIPIGRSHRSGPHTGFQFCPMCLKSGEPHFKWHWRIAFVCCCPTHRILLQDKCPKCGNSIHATSQGLWGLRAEPRMDYLIRMERCRHCQFDLRHTPTKPASELLVSRQKALVEKVEAAGKGTNGSAADWFAVLRHILTLIVGPNLGLEQLRRVVANCSLVSRVDVPLPYEPDAEILPFEELAVESRVLALQAATWLAEKWPTRFVDCARTAKVEYPALNRNAISVPWFNEAAMAGYSWHDIEAQTSAKKQSQRPVIAATTRREHG